MILIYILIGLAVVYAAFVFGTRRDSNQAGLAGHLNEPAPGNTHVHDSLDGSSHINGASEETHKQHKGHGCC